LKFIVMGGLMAAAILFIEGGVVHSNLRLQFSLGDLKAVKDHQAVSEMLRSTGNDNGVQFHGQGIFIASRTRADGKIGPVYEQDDPTPLINQAALCCVIGVLLAFLVNAVTSRSVATSAVSVALFCGFVALVTGVHAHLPQTVWYGFPIRYSVFQIVDHVVQWTIAGFFLGYLRGRRSGGVIPQDGKED